MKKSRPTRMSFSACSRSRDVYSAASSAEATLNRSIHSFVVDYEVLFFQLLYLGKESGSWNLKPVKNLLDMLWSFLQ